MADLKITELPPLAGALLQADDPFAVADLSASETKKITAKDLVQGGVALIDDGSIPSVKVNLTLPPGSVGTAELADHSVTALKLADSSTATLQAGLPAIGAYLGQLTVNTTDNKAYIWNGGAWLPFKAGGSINQIIGDATGAVRLDVTEAGGVATLNTYLADSTGAREVLIGPTNGGGAVTARQLIGSDLPLATGVTIGAVQVGGSGLVMNGNQIAIDNSVTPTSGGGVYGVVEYSAEGLVTAGRAISSADLPVALVGQPGAIQPGIEFSIGVNGTLLHTNNVAPGTATKVVYDAQGHITAAQALADTDIPNLPASKITSGTLPAAVIGDASISRLKLADYCISYIQEGQPTDIDPGSVGMLWLQESTAQLRMWNGNSWFAVGLGRAVQENLRWGGLIDASTGLVMIVTQYGLSSGLIVGAPLPQPNDLLGGLYVVVQVGGNAIGVTPGLVYDEGDWCLCVDQANGYVRIDTMTGGGGGPGAQFLDDLVDVTLTTPQDGDMLVFETIAGVWINKPTIDASKLTGELNGGVF